MASDFNPQFQKIGEILIHAGKIDESQLNSALAEQKKTNELLTKLNTRVWCVLVGVAAILIFVIRRS